MSTSTLLQDCLDYFHGYDLERTDGKSSPIVTRLEAALEQTPSSLRQILTAYLSERGWYQDLEHAQLNPDSGWTVPQWGNYWRKTDGTGTTSRRYENFLQAVQTQLGREDDPESYEHFFNLPAEPSL